MHVRNSYCMPTRAIPELLHQAISVTYIFYMQVCNNYNIHLLYASVQYLVTYTFICNCAIYEVLSKLL